MRTLTLLFLLAFGVSTSLFAAETNISYRITGLFQPDRVDDFKQVASTLGEKDQPPDAKLVDVKYETAIATFSYDPESKNFKNRKPEQVLERLNNFVRNNSRSTFSLFPANAKAGQLKEEKIPVVGLDCKGCAYGAYRCIASIEGMDHAVVSFKDGIVTAWIDAEKTNRAALITALTKAQVDVVEARKPPPEKKDDKKEEKKDKPAEKPPEKK